MRLNLRRESDGSVAHDDIGLPCRSGVSRNFRWADREKSIHVLLDLRLERIKYFWHLELSHPSLPSHKTDPLHFIKVPSQTQQPIIIFRQNSSKLHQTNPFHPENPTIPPSFFVCFEIFTKTIFDQKSTHRTQPLNIPTFKDTSNA